MSLVYKVINFFVCLRIKLALWMIQRGSSHIEKKRKHYSIIDSIVTIDDHMLKLTFSNNSLEIRFRGPTPAGGHVSLDSMVPRFPGPLPHELPQLRRVDDESVSDPKTN